MKKSRQEKGTWAEDQALEWIQKRLTEKGGRILGRNIRYRVGELDWVFEEGDCLVFLEVRNRVSAINFQTALESVCTRKQRRLIAAAKLFLLSYVTPPQIQQMRFDLFTLDRGEACYIERAFTL